MFSDEVTSIVTDVTTIIAGLCAMQDFIAYQPVHQVEMQTASVKELPKYRLQLHTPRVAFLCVSYILLSIFILLFSLYAAV